MNLPGVAVVRGADGLSCVVVVTSAAPDGRPGCYWSLHKPTGEMLSYGHSAGWQGSGLASFHTAMKNGKAAAKRWITRQWLELHKDEG